jgi:branched-chain amino acid transport system permease protein
VSAARLSFAAPFAASAAGAACLAVAVAAAFVLPPFYLHQLTIAAAYCVALVGLNIVVGVTGQVSLAQGAFFGIGAYAAALMRISFDSPLIVALACAGLVSMLAGLVGGLPALRLRGHYLAVATLSIAVAVPPLITRWSTLTGGASGLNAGFLMPPSWVPLKPDQYLYAWSIAVTAPALYIAHRVVQSPLGIAMQAVRDNEVAATGMGVDLARIKASAFAVSAMFAGIGGGLFAVGVGFVAQENFTPTLSLLLLAAMVIGGSGSIAGSVIGALFLEFVPDYAAALSKYLAGVLFGLAIILAIRFMPQGPLALVSKLIWPRLLVRDDPSIRSATALDRVEKGETGNRLMF